MVILTRQIWLYQETWYFQEGGFNLKIPGLEIIGYYSELEMEQWLLPVIL
jgi:hypothetical protein